MQTGVVDEYFHSLMKYHVYGINEDSDRPDEQVAF